MKFLKPALFVCGLFWAHNLLAQAVEDLERQVLSRYLSAERERLLGNSNEALRLYRECLLLDPKNDGALYESAKLLAANGQKDAALNYLEQCARIDANNKWYQQHLALAYADDQKFAKSANLFHRLQEAEPLNSDYVLNEGNLLLLAGKVKKAMTTYERLEQFDTFEPSVGYSIYRRLLAADQPRQAEKYLLHLISLFQDEVSLYGQLAEHYANTGRQREAAGIVKKALSLDPENAYLQLNYAEQLDRASKTDSAEYFLLKAFGNSSLDIDTKVSMLLRIYDQSSRDADLLNRALALCEKLVEAHPDEAKAYSMRGDFLFLHREVSAARLSYYEAVALDPSRFALWNQIMLIDMEFAEYDRLKADAGQCLEYFPDQPVAHFYRGLAATRESDHLGAIKHLKTASSLVSANPLLEGQCLAALGDAYQSAENHPASDSAFDAALLIDSNNVYVLNNYGYFLSLRGEWLEKALRMSAKTVAVEPNNSSYLDTYAWILHRLNRHTEAELFIQRALNNGGNGSAEVLEHAGDIAAALKKTNEAVTFWQKALEVGGPNARITEKINAGIVP